MNDCYTHVESNVYYIVENILGPVEHSLEYEQLISNFNSQITDPCKCEKVCSPPSCKCLQRSRGVNYITFCEDELQKYKLNRKEETFPIFECNESCSCSLECKNRIVQKGPIEGLEIKPCDKGFGLYTTCFIPEGVFVCEYAGELITKSQAASRHEKNMACGRMNYIFCLKEHSRDSVVETFVDPSVFGNIGRYMNHSCEPNCHVVPVRCDNLVPKLAIFTCMEVMKNEELTFHYGAKDICGSQSKNKIRCLCKSDDCGGFMPFHEY